MIQLIKKGGLRERANRSRRYVGSENTVTTLLPNQYTDKTTAEKNDPVQPNAQDHLKIVSEK